MMLWWWTIAVWLLARLGPGLGERFPTMPSLPDSPPTRTKAWLAVAATVVAFLAMPPVRSLIPNAQTNLDHTVHAGTPWRLALELTAGPGYKGRWQPELRKGLRDYYPDAQFRGSIFASETQGDMLVWALPPELPVLMSTHAHVFPVDHWEACRHVKAANPGWREFIARHGVNLIVIETDTHEELAAALREDKDWLVIQDGPQGAPDRPANVMIALRKRPL
jgi:hypothetical protein